MDVVCYNNWPHALGSNGDVLSGMVLLCTHTHGLMSSLLTCGVHLCAAQIALTLGVLIRPSCGLYLTGALGSDNCSLTSSAQVQRVNRIK